jgi:peptide/nickel transport system substrate-binding protein
MPTTPDRSMHLLVCALFCLACLGCSKVVQTSTGVARHGFTQPGVLRVAIAQDAKTLDPILSSTTVDGFVDRLLFEPLISADAHAQPVPMLATAVPTLRNGGISPDGLTIVYHLRRDAHWSDGVPVTSRDVTWSWQAIMNPANNAVSRHGYDVVRSIETPDEHTVVVHLKTPFAPFVNTFFAESDQPYNVAPAHVLSKYATINQIPFNTAPVVSDGPFRFVEWVHGDHILLTANDDFFMGSPKLRQIRIEVIPDENTSIQLLRTHEVDYMFQASINTNQELKSIPDVRIVWNNMNGFEGIGFNLSHGALRDPRVRAAIISAIDKPTLVRNLTGGQEKTATEDLPDWMWAFNPDALPPSYDPGRAKRLLVQAGYTIGPDGVARRNGQPLQLLFASDSSDVTHRKLIVLVQSMLHAVGIDTVIKLYPPDLLYAPAGMGGIMHGGKFDLITEPWYAGIDPDDSSQFMCRYIPPAGYDDTRYCNPEMDALQLQALSTYAQPARRQAYLKIEALLARDNPQIFIWWQRQQEPVSVDFRGFAPNPVVESWNAWQWSI